MERDRRKERFEEPSHANGDKLEARLVYPVNSLVGSGSGGNRSKNISGGGRAGAGRCEWATEDNGEGGAAALSESEDAFEDGELITGGPVGAHSQNATRRVEARHGASQADGARGSRGAAAASHLRQTGSSARHAEASAGSAGAKHGPEGSPQRPADQFLQRSASVRAPVAAPAYLDRQGGADARGPPPAAPSTRELSFSTSVPNPLLRTGSAGQSAGRRRKSDRPDEMSPRRAPANNDSEAGPASDQANPRNFNRSASDPPEILLGRVRRPSPDAERGSHPRHAAVHPPAEEDGRNHDGRRRLRRRRSASMSRLDTLAGAESAVDEALRDAQQLFESVDAERGGGGRGDRRRQTGGHGLHGEEGHSLGEARASGRHDRPGGDRRGAHTRSADERLAEGGGRPQDDRHPGERHDGRWTISSERDAAHTAATRVQPAGRG